MLALIENTVLPQNQTAYDTLRSAYASGRATFMELLDAEQMLIDAKLERDGARRDLNRTRLREAEVTGRLP
jgi:outer membrane protein TolC